MPDYYTPDEVAAMFKVKRTTVLSWHRAGRLAAVVLPGTRLVRFTPDAVKAFAAQATTAKAAQ